MRSARALHTTKSHQTWRHGADETFSLYFRSEDIYILILIWVCITGHATSNKSLLVWAMACRRAGDKPLPEPIMTKINDYFVTRGWWVKAEWQRRHQICTYRKESDTYRGVNQGAPLRRILSYDTNGVNVTKQLLLFAIEWTKCCERCVEPYYSIWCYCVMV